MLRQAKRLLTGVVELCTILVEERLAEESREDLERRLREAVDRGAQLALEKAILEDKLDGLRFNGPSLYRDEVDCLRHVLPGQCKEVRDVIRRLLDRCDHMPMTEDELRSIAEEAIRDCTAHITDDPGSDVDDLRGTKCDHKDVYGSLMSDERCMACGERGGDDDIPF